MDKLKLEHLDAYKVEIQIGNKFGLAIKNENGQWDISPNMQEHSEIILKRLKETKTTAPAITIAVSLKKKRQHA